MLARCLAILPLLALQLMLPTVSTAGARTIAWSGYTWDVRPAGFGGPGPNEWSDSESNVHVDGTDLVLSIVRDASGRWTSAEVDNQQHLGYGTYRWTVASDLTGLDANEVLGMFTYGGSSPSNNELDIEASHWGDLSWPTGSATVWQDADAWRQHVRSFPYSDRPPYVNQFTWAPGKVSYLVTDATGATLFRWTVTRGVPTPSSEVPRINYWRTPGEPPTSARSMRISSFTWIPLGREDEQPPTRGAGAGRRVRLAMRPRRFAVSGPRRGSVLRWKAAARTAVRLVVKRRLRRQVVDVGSLERVVRRGAGHMRLTGRVEGHKLRPGRYLLIVRSAGCAASTLRFTVYRT
jgi:hypothetical protein